MSIWYVDEVRHYSDNASRMAISKARQDVSRTLHDAGCREIRIETQDNRAHARKLKKIELHWRVYQKWLRAMSKVSNGDVVIIQYPIYDHTLFVGRLFEKVQARGAHVALLIHDVEMFRELVRQEQSKVADTWSSRFGKEENSALRAADILIAHNQRMVRILRDKLNVEGQRIISLGVFDYRLDDDQVPDRMGQNKDLGIAIAGNLAKEKAGYVYALPQAPQFRLYGVNYSGTKQEENVEYEGSFDPVELPKKLSASFGLVWDGPSPSTCEGTNGRYLIINNPHKASLYLASDLPVIIWSQAALADFVVNNGVGLTIDSLDQLDEAIRRLSDSEYRKMLQNAHTIGMRLRNGDYLQDVLSELKR